MTTETDSLVGNYIRSRAITAKSNLMGNVSTPTVISERKHAHETSLVSFGHHPPSRRLKRPETFQTFSASLLKNKTLLVPTRLALRRQRAALKSPSLQYEPMQSETFQIVLGNPTDQDERTSPEYHQIKSASNSTSQHKEDISHPLPTDISLMYKEKPSFIHPVTGHYIVHYTEDGGSPSPCSYVLPRKSCREKSAPAYSFGTRCLVEKKGGSRTAWQKQWFAHSNPFTTKVDFNRENTWPTPFHYPARPTIGFQATKVTFPAWSIATRLAPSPALIVENNPAPDTYDTSTAFRKLTAKTTLITIQSRTGGTQISTNHSTDKTPGPGAHDERKFFSNKPSSPRYSFGKRIPASLSQDPYVNVLPALQTSS